MSTDSHPVPSTLGLIHQWSPLSVEQDRLAEKDRIMVRSSGKRQADPSRSASLEMSLAKYPPGGKMAFCLKTSPE